MPPVIDGVPKPTWTSASFLLYAGGLTVLFSAIGALSFLSGEYGSGATVAWTLLPLFVLFAVAQAFKRRGEWIAAGLFAFAGVAMWIAFSGSLLSWWGWLPNDQTDPLRGWHWGTWLLLLLILVAAAVTLGAFRFPLLIVYVLSTTYFLLADFLSNGGNWSAVLTLLIGLVYLMIGVTVDGGPRQPYGFWLHLFAGFMIGGALLFWWHSSETDFALLATAGVVFVGIASRTRRSSWAVLGVGAFAAAATHWSNEWTHSGFSVFAPTRDWVAPLVFAVVGFFWVLLGLLVERRQRRMA
jgi:hypothetical protein